MTTLALRCRDAAAMLGLLLLAACGGGGSTPPMPPEPPPATGSGDSFTDAVMLGAAMQEDDSEPTAIDRLALTEPEDKEPIAVK